MHKYIKSLGLVVMAAMMAFAFAACNNKQDSIVGDLTVDKTELAFVQIGQAQVITAKLGDDIAADAEWTVDNADVAKVVRGVVTAIGNGTATVTVNAGEQSKDVAVTVTSEFGLAIKSGDAVVDYSRIELSTANTNSVDLTADVTYPVASEYVIADGITWSTNDKTVATVDAAGKVTAVGAGFATISAVTNACYPVEVPTMGGSTIVVQQAVSKVIISVNNEFDAEDNAELLGLYSNEVEWLGFANAAQQTEANKDKSAENLKKIDGITEFTLKEDGSFLQFTYNAKRAGYTVIANPTETQSMFANCHVYNNVLTEAKTPEHHALAKFAMNNFKESGFFGIFGGELRVVFIAGSVIEYKTLGAVADNDWADNDFVPFSSQSIKFHSDMNKALTKVVD